MKTDINWQSLQSGISPDALWKKKARAGLVAYAKRESNQTESVYSHTLVRWPRYATVGAIVLILILIPRTIVAAQSSRPGQLLYPFKRLTENAQLLLATGDKKTSVQVAQSEKRTDELDTSIEHDSEDMQLQATSEVEASQRTIDKLPEKIRQDTRRRVKLKLEDVKNRVKHQRVKERLEAMIEAFDFPPPTPTGTKKSPTATIVPSKPPSSGTSGSQVHVENNNGYTQVIINGTVVVTKAADNNSNVTVNVSGGSVRVKTNSHSNSEYSVDVDTDN